LISAIPKAIRLAGFTIEVVFSKTLYKDKGRVAEAVYQEHRIVIDNSIMPLEAMAQAFYHELLHFVYYVLNEDEMRQNEKLIDVMAHLLLQASQATEHYTVEEMKR
jgi:hypothetical protein